MMFRTSTMKCAPNNNKRESTRRGLNREMREIRQIINRFRCLIAKNKFKKKYKDRERRKEIGSELKA